uniref:Uncharacterized protein n=1 Tax=Timema poppense TaxID=170557 RepID=A0A7R9DBW2_TIMPO|nr:unnamed protein product [Timema poppensis]
MEAGNGGTVLPPPPADSLHLHTAGVPPQRKGDGARYQAIVVQTGSVVLPKPVVVATAGWSSAPKSGYSGPVNPVGDRDPLSWLEEQLTNSLNRLQDHGVSANDHVGLLLNSTDSTLNPVYVSFRRSDQLDARAVLDNAICDNKIEPGGMDENIVKKIKMGRPIQKLKAEELCHDADVNLVNGG